MTLGCAVLCKNAAILESKELKKISFDSALVPSLEALLLDVYAILRPRPVDYEQRRHLVRTFSSLAMDIFGNNNGFPIVEAFGSFTMDLFTATSDLDLSVNFSDNDMRDFPRDRKISVLKKFSRALYAHQRRGHVSGVQPILKARVPVLKVVDCGTGIECDISVENKDGISRSMFFSLVSSIDERFHILSYLMKFWAKTRNPPILPPFSVILKDGTDISRIQNIANGLKQFGRRNRESIAELFVALLSKLSSVENLWQDGLCASTYEGSWVSKTWKSGAGNMNVEDFLDRTQNFARSVGKIEMQKICRCIRGSLGNLSCFLIGQIGASKLKALLFESMHPSIPSDQLLYNEEMKHARGYAFSDSGALVDPITTKKARYSEEMKHTRGYAFSDSGALIDPITTKKARYTDCTREPYGYETPTALPNLSIPLFPPLLPSHPNNGAYHLEPLVIPFHKGYGLEYHPQYLAGSSRLAYGLHHELQLPFAQLGYGSEHLRPRPFQFYPGSPLHQHEQNLMDHRT